MLVRITKDGKPVQRATVNFWGSRATFRDIYAEPGNSPYMKKKTDANGEFTINDIYRMFIPDYNNTPNLPPKSPVDEFPFSRWYCFVVEVELDGGQTKSVWLSDLDIVPEYLNGGEGCSGVPLPCPRSEERRVGKECRSRWSPYH